MADSEEEALETAQKLAALYNAKDWIEEDQRCYWRVDSVGDLDLVEPMTQEEVEQDLEEEAEVIEDRIDEFVEDEDREIFEGIIGTVASGRPMG